MGETRKQKQARRVRQKIINREPSKASQLRRLLRQLEEDYPESKEQ